MKRRELAINMPHAISWPLLCVGSDLGCESLETPAALLKNNTHLHGLQTLIRGRIPVGSFPSSSYGLCTLA